MAPVQGTQQKQCRKTIATKAINTNPMRNVISQGRFCINTLRRGSVPSFFSVLDAVIDGPQGPGDRLGGRILVALRAKLVGEELGAKVGKWLGEALGAPLTQA